MVKRFFHWLAHLTGQNEGKIVTYKEDGYICLAFQCSKCGEIDPKTIDKILESELENE